MAAHTSFHVLLEPVEDGFFHASVPALKGCHSQGATREEALENIREAIEGWLEAADAYAISMLPSSNQDELVSISI